MLILTRKLYEVVVVGDHTLVTYMGYCPSTTIHTFSVTDARTETGSVVQLRPEDDTVIDENVVMKVLQRKNAKARLGFSAPRNVNIDRLETRQQEQGA